MHYNGWEFNYLGINPLIHSCQILTAFPCHVTLPQQCNIQGVQQLLLKSLAEEDFYYNYLIIN